MGVAVYPFGLSDPLNSTLRVVWPYPDFKELTMPTPRCVRPGCSDVLPPGRTKYCSPACAKAAQQEQLDANTERRREARSKTPKPKCAIPECGKEFTRVSSSHKYCGVPCSLKGLQAAIDRQRQRREEVKKLKSQQRQFKSVD